MQVMTGLAGFLTPLLIGSWIGTRARHPVAAFFLGWIATPFVAFVTALGLIAFIDSPMADMVAIELPIAGIGIGLISGTAAVIIVRRRQATANPPPAESSGESKG